ncbi:MAG: hypothetical protein K5650_01920 [Bacteroidales bacterium]|nr:hypothetical protein [Bacteroidales bacterium]
MKKTLVILLVAAFATAAHAQHHNETPTLPTERTDSYLIDSVSRSVMFSSTCYLGRTITYGNSLNDYDISVRLDTAPEGLTIYGIAISAVHY